MAIKQIYNWGKYPKTQATIYSPTCIEELKEAVISTNTLICRGNGKCYGDSSLAKNVISTLNLKKIISFDEISGEIECEAGVLISDILNKIVPSGFFLPVTPGTKFITIGGALASDMHGKNHPLNGSFSSHVIAFNLMNEKGEINKIVPTDDIFWQTAGGLGATGIIISVHFKLMPIETSFIKQKSIQVRNLTELIRLISSDTTSSYIIAWIDFSSIGSNLGRSVLTTGEHALNNDVEQSLKNKLPTHGNSKYNIPINLPSFILNPWSIRLFNFIVYHKTHFKRDVILHYDDFFFPLDAVTNWNRIYGNKGFIEYQVALPDSVITEGLEKLFKLLKENNITSYLCVIKKFGSNCSNKYLNFPVKGITLALDFKINNQIWSVLDDMDKIVTELGGRVYLTKDARINKKIFHQQYQQQIPHSKKFISHQMIRLQQDNNNVLLVLGANSDIAKEYILEYISKNKDCRVILASRNTKELNEFIKKNHLEKHADIQEFDAERLEAHASFVLNLPQKPTEILYAAGFCPTNEDCINSSEIWIKNVTVNYLGAVSVLNHLVADDNPFLKRIIGISSIAGLRGRKTNYMYGSSKAGFYQYLNGLKRTLKSRNIIVQSVLPGAVRTKMTAHQKLPFFAIEPKEIAYKMINNRTSFQIYPNLLWKSIAYIVRFFPVDF